MANEEHTKILEQGVLPWNQWRIDNPGVRPDLSGISFRMGNPSNLGRDLSQVNFRRADLTNADFYRSWLVGADFTEAEIKNAGFGQATLGDAKFNGAYSEGANFMQSHLFQADFTGARLHGAYFYGAMLEKAIFTGTTLKDQWFEAANLKNANLRDCDLRDANLVGANLQEADLTGADCRWADFEGTRLIRTVVENTQFENAFVHGASVWDLKGTPKNQTELVITPKDDMRRVTVDDLEVSQFIYLLLNDKKLRNVINAVTKRGVLLLGRFREGGLEVLHALAEALRKLKYLPIVFTFDRPTGRDYTETVQTLAGLSRFVIVNLDGPSVPQELYATVPHIAIPYVPIIEQGRKPYSMLSDLRKFTWFVWPPVEFMDIADLIELAKARIVESAEKRANEIFKNVVEG